MSPLLSSLRRCLAALLLALAAPAAIHLALASSDEEDSSPGIAALKNSAAKSDTDGESVELESEPATPDADDPVDFDDSSSDAPKAPAVMPTDPAASPASPPAELSTPTAKPDQAAADPPKKPGGGPKNPSLARDKAAANHKYMLAYKFKAGEVIRWEVVHRAVVDTTIQGTNQTAETRSTSIKAWQVTDVSDDGEVTLVHMVESIDMWQKMQGRQEVHYNSRTDDKVPPGYEEIAKAVGVPLTLVTIDMHGSVLKREEKHRQSNASNMPLAVPLPAEPVVVGDSWTVPSDVDVVLHGGATRKIQTRQTFVLEKVAGNLATISVDTQVLTPLNDPAIEAQLVQRFTNGTLRFDMEMGRVVSQQLDLDRKVVGFSGTSSSMHYLTRFTEELLTDNSPVVMKKLPVRAATTAMPNAPAQPVGPPATAKGPKPRTKPAQR